MGVAKMGVAKMGVGEMALLETFTSLQIIVLMY